MIKKLAIPPTRSGGILGKHSGRLRLALLVPAILVVIGGCHRQHGASITCHVPVPAQPTKVTVISYESHGMPYFADQMTKCSEGPLVVRHQMLPYDELVNQATISMSAKSPSPYGIVHVYDQLLVEWAGKGWLAPLDDLVQKYWNQYRLDEIPPKLWDMMKVNGHIYAIPGIQNPEIFMYRKDVFEKYGLKPPQIYADLTTLCTALKAKDAAVPYPLLMMYSKSSDHIAYEFYDLMHSMGGHWFNDDGSPAFNSDIGQQALEQMTALYHACVHPDIVNSTPEDAIIGLQQGQFLMAILWVNESPQLDNPQLSKFAGKFGFAPAPGACPSCAPAAYWAQDSWVIPANASVNRELLFRIAMEGVQTRNQAAAAKIALVTRSSVAKADQTPYWRAGMLTIERGAVGLDRRTYSYLAREAVSRYAVEALLGHLTAKQALDRAAADYTAEMHEEGFLK